MTKLQDICLLITDGKHGDCQNESDSGYYFVSCKDVRDGHIDYSGARQITEDDFHDTHRRTQLQANDIVITNSGTIGRMALVPNVPETKCTTFQKSVGIVKPNQQKVIPQWLYYYLFANRERLISWAGGTAQKNLLLRDMRAFGVEVPPFSVQKKSASILSNYDDLIENNTRRITILEEMARRIYTEWFVHFRFPGHEKVRMVDSELGPIPSGWEVTPLPEVVFFQEGPGLRKWQWTDSGMKVINVKNILPDGSMEINNTSRFISLEEFETKYSHFEICEGDIVVASSGNTYGKIGKILRHHLPLMMNTSVIRFRSKSNKILTNSHLYWFMRFGSFLGQVENFVIGSAQPNFGPTHLKRMHILVPPISIQQASSGILGTANILIDRLREKIINLRQTRDLLLPKLISGEIDVSEMEIAA